MNHKNDDRNLLDGRWVASWTNITSTGTAPSITFAFAATLGVFIFNADGTVRGEFRLKDGTDFNVRTFAGTFAATWDPTTETLSGTVTVTLDVTGNVNTMSFVWVNPDKLCFVLERATKADGTLRTLMVHGSLHRVRPQ